MNESGLVVIQPGQVPETLHNTIKSVVRQSNDISGEGYIEHIGIKEVKRIMDCARDTREGERDALLIGLLFDSCLRISELLQLTPQKIDRTGNRIKAQNLKRANHQIEVSWVGISETIKNQLIAFVWANHIPDDERIFPITRFRAHQILTRAMNIAGVVKPDHTGRVHIMRHSGAIALLEKTGNIQLVRGQLRHSQVRMSMNYLRTFARDEAVKAKGNIDYWRT